MEVFLLKSNHNINPICHIDSFLSDEEIKKILNYSEQISYEISKIGKPEKEKKEFSLDSHIKNLNNGNVPRVRLSNIKWIPPQNEIKWLYKKISSEVNKINLENFNFILRYIECLQFTEYTETQSGFYSKHNDCGNKDEITNFIDIRKLSFSIQLTDAEEYDGGELVFYLSEGSKKIIAPKTKGTIVFFKSDILHEVLPVKKGIRQSLVGWVDGPNLK